MKLIAMRMPPAATNGIMYDTPVISHCRSLVPAPTLSGVADRRGVPGGRGGRLRVARALLRRGLAWAMSPGPSEMARFTPTSMTGLPANRCLSWTSRSWAKITASAASMTDWAIGSEPAEPWVSTTIS